MSSASSTATNINIVEDTSWYKGKPVIRVWELNENSTRYDVITAGPSDDHLHKYWWTWAVVALLVGIASFVVFLGIATSRKARQNPFNVYLLYLSVPDFVFSLSCGITCLLNAVNGEYWAAWMCTFQQWYCVFGIGSNAWLNACVVRELYTMLKFSDKRRRYKSPTRVFVSKQAIAVYLFMGFLGCWGAIEAPNWPFHAGATSGLACLPIEVDLTSSLFFWLAFFPLFAGIPSVYIIYVTYQIWKHKLLPPTGKRRLLAIYFGRLVLVFYVMWLPTLIILFAFSSFVPPWAHFVGGLWSHLQGAVSAAASLMKPDIYRATRRVLTCHCCRRTSEEEEKENHERNNNDPSAILRSSRFSPDGGRGTSRVSRWSLWSFRSFQGAAPANNSSSSRAKSSSQASQDKLREIISFYEQEDRLHHLHDGPGGGEQDQSQGSWCTNPQEGPRAGGAGTPQHYAADAAEKTEAAGVARALHQQQQQPFPRPGRPSCSSRELWPSLELNSMRNESSNRGSYQDDSLIFSSQQQRASSVELNGLDEEGEDGGGDTFAAFDSEEVNDEELLLESTQKGEDDPERSLDEESSPP